MYAKSPLENIYKNHRAVEKSIQGLDNLIAKLESNGLQAFHDQHHQIQKIRRSIKRNFLVHFRQEEEVLFPLLQKYFPESESSIIKFLSQHAELKHLLDNVVGAIDDENVEEFIQNIQETSEKILLLIEEKDAFYNDLPPDIIPPKQYQEINHQMNIIKESIFEEVY